ncbi:hypothetical protein ACX3UK_03480 [Lactobacillus gasseri]|uniref:hypothetical protein n=1 Tax=Lactobacillus gasseri TaxID=1596 RepID=UPI000E42DA4C|nr:hypothetical protein [Lactobacillus gasseri]MCT7705378.1 hypothetical protein [Lactobacillus gasseri]MCZ3948396.1 hypothetical protein [Lactobacillus gasseri]RGL14248.1 hypothetical protein DXC77_08940 [Lactobacillus gasseri]
MDSNNLIFVKLEHKRLLYNLIADVLLIVGAILIFRQPAMSLVVQLLGSLMIIFATIFTILSFKIRSSKQYRALSLLVKNEPTSLKEIVNSFGAGMTFLALFMALGFIVIIVIFFFLLSRSWIKALLFFITFETVIDLKDFMNNLTKLKDESMI